MSQETEKTSQIIQALTEQGQRFLIDPRIVNKPQPEKILFCLQQLCQESLTSSFAPPEAILLRYKLRELTGIACEPIRYNLINISSDRQLFALIPIFSPVNINHHQIKNPQLPLVAFINEGNLVVATQNRYLSIVPDGNALHVALKVTFGQDTEPANQAVTSAFQAASKFLPKLS
ncbi:MAG: hypothetical protein V1810_02210 [Candidatus Beckwithbacteria bacterium]